MMHPGLAAQLAPSSNYSDLTLVDPYLQAKEQNYLFQQQLYKLQNNNNCFQSDSSQGFNTPTT